MIDVLWLDGTGSDGLATTAPSHAVEQALDHTRFKFRRISYPAAYGPVTGYDPSYAESLVIGAGAIAAAARPGVATVVGGYSQGAAGARKFVRDVLPTRPDLDVIAFASIADPHTEAHGPGNRYSGIAGPLPLPADLARFVVWAPGDTIADLPEGNPLRSLADLSEWMAVRSLADVRQWGEDVLADALAGRAQRWWAPWLWDQWGGAIAYAKGYLIDGRHTTDYVRYGHSARLAGQLNARFAV